MLFEEKHEHQAIAIGKMFGRYQIRGELDHGGMGGAHVTGGMAILQKFKVEIKRKRSEYDNHCFDKLLF